MSMKPREIGRYLLNVERVSYQYNIKISDLLTLVDYQEEKRMDRGKDRDLEHSLNVVERFLHWEDRK